MKIFALFLRGAGYSGLLVLIDELVNLYKIPNSISRQYNYEKVLTIYNDALQGRTRYLGILMGGTPQAVEDQRRGLFSLGEKDFARFLEIEYDREGASSHLTPREIIRDFIEALNLFMQHPDLTVETLFKSGEFAPAEKAEADRDKEKLFAEFDI